MKLCAGICAPLTAIRSEWFDSEADAVKFCTEQIGPNQTQVSIQTSGGGTDTFAMRHFVWTAGTVRDSGWRGWVNGEFFGDVTLAQIEEAVANTASFRCGCVYLRSEAKCVERCDRHQGRKP